MSGAAQPGGEAACITAGISQAERSRHGLVFVGLLLLDGVGYLGSTCFAIASLPLAINLLAAISAGVFIGTLFVLGHDACHQTASRRRQVNLWLGRVCFIPSAHAASLWILGHNRIHHGFTNLRGHDYVWEPMSPADYRRASAWRRAFYRLYRGPFGPLPYYLIEMWWKKNFLPIAPEARREWRRHVGDSLFAVLATAVLIAAILAAATVMAPQRPLLQSFVVGWLIPFLVWNWLIGIVIYVHHTHPTLPWLDDAKAWRAERVAVAGTAQVRLPQPLHLLSNNIMEHNAHHARPDLPLAALKPLQAELRARAPRIPVYRLTPAVYCRTVRTCRLYDYAARRWVDYDGTPTGPVLDVPLL